MADFKPAADHPLLSGDAKTEAGKSPDDTYTAHCDLAEDLLQLGGLKSEASSTQEKQLTRAVALQVSFQLTLELDMQFLSSKMTSARQWNFKNEVKVHGQAKQIADSVRDDILEREDRRRPTTGSVSTDPSFV